MDSTNIANDPSTDEDGSESIDSALQKRAYVMKELVETEEKYVEDLKMVCDGYLAHMRDPECSIPMPEDLRSGKDKIVFGNIEAIYEWHRELVLPLFLIDLIFWRSYIFIPLSFNCLLYEQYYLKLV